MNESIVRSLSGIVYIALLLTATLYSDISFIALFAIFLLIAVTEFVRLVNLTKVLPLIIAAAMFAIFGLFNRNNTGNNLVLVFASLFVGIMLLYDLFRTGMPRHTDQTGKYVLLIGYVILPFLLLIKLPFLGGSYNPFIIVGIYILMWVNDTFAYITGKTFGRRKLFERISPKKTIEGFAGGLIFTMISAYIISMYYDFIPPLQWITTGAILSVFGTLGDLVESKFKRNAGVKDSGNIMPGHGGILDRLDSIIFALPFLFLYYQIILYVS